MTDFTEAPVSLTFKAGEGWAAPMLTLRELTGSDLADTLVEVREHPELLDLIVEVAGLFTVKYGLQPESAKPAPAPSRSSGKPATAGQLSYLNDLRTERGLEPVSGVSAEEASAEIDKLKSEPKSTHGGRSQGGGGSRGFQGRGKGGGGNTASVAQVGKIKELLEEREVADEDIPDDIDGLSKKDASEFIDFLIASPEKRKKAWGR
jgi:hypothetical protein